MFLLSKIERKANVVKTLTVTIRDFTDETDFSIRGMRNEKEFNKMIILSTDFGQVAIDSQTLAEALAEVVNFQSKGFLDGQVHMERQGVSEGSIQQATELMGTLPGFGEMAHKDGV